MHKLHRTAKRIFSTTVLASLALMFGVLALAPWIGEVASAVDTAPSNVNLAERRVGVANSPSLQGCSGYFANEIKNGSFLANNFTPQEELDYLLGLSPADLANAGEVDTYIGTFNTFDANQRNQLNSIIQSLNQSVPVIKFRAGDPGSNTINGPFANGGSNICNSITMIQVSATEWRGWQRQIDDDELPAQFMTFTINPTAQTGANRAGTLQYYNFTQNNPSSRQTANGFVVAGTPAGGGGPGSGTINIGAISGEWIDAAHIKLTSGLYSGEIYQKFRWDAASKNGDENWSLYFLVTTSPANDRNPNASRSTITWESGKGCDNPISTTSGATDTPAGACTNKGGSPGHCVPFVAVNQRININQASDGNNGTFIPNTGQLQQRINALGNATATLYDYSAEDCHYLGKSSGTKLGAQENARVWFYYSTQNKAIITVFSLGAGNETRYIGNYPNVSEGAQHTFRGPGTRCDATAVMSFNTSTTARYPVSWTMTDGNCARPTGFGSVNVLAQGGANGEVGYGEITGNINDGGDGIPIGQEPRIGCEFIEGNPLNWLVCPLVKGASNLVELLDSAINQMLTIDVTDIFNDQQQPGKAYHQAWGVFRTFALAIIAIAALIMVIAQAAGLDFLDAYTIRKILPRLLMAAIGITLSWELMEFAVTLSNDVGNGIRAIIYAPFQSLSEAGVGLSNLSKSIILLFSVGGLLAYGWFGLLTLVVTGVLAVLVAFLSLTFRRILIIFLVMVAPFAIACSILPNTQRAWKLWRDSLMSALVVFLIISAFIAVGRVFSLTAMVSSTNQGFDQSLSQVIAVVAYFAPYFLIPLAFRLAGGFIATVGGMVNDRSRGMFDRLRQARAQRPGQRYEAFQHGRFGSDNFLLNPRRRVIGAPMRGVNALGQRWNLGLANRFGFTAQGHAAEAVHTNAEIDETLRNNHNLAELANNDDANAVMAFSGDTMGGAQSAARQLFRRADGSYDEARGQAAIAAASAVGFQKGNSAAALKTVAQNKSRAVGAGRVDVVADGIHRLAGDNHSMQQGLSYMYQYWSRSQGGRTDLGGNWMANGVIDAADTAGAQTQAAGLAAGLAPDQIQQRVQQSRQRVISDLTMLDGINRTEAPNLVRGHPAQLQQATRSLRRILMDATPIPAGAAGDAQRQTLSTAAQRVIELQSALPYANGDSQRILNEFKEQMDTIAVNRGGAPQAQVGVDTQMAELIRDRVGATAAGVSAQELAQQLRSRARVYSQEQYAGAGGAGGAGPAPI